MRRSPLGLLLVAVLIALGVFLLVRPGRQAVAGPAVALCPGPDAFGYTCANGQQYAYIDAANDIRLYRDDGVLELPLPFPFTVYDETFETVVVSSNGNLQFTTAVPGYLNQCLWEGPAAAMGIMIAPFWDDLDLSIIGQVDTAVVGEAPARIFVIEWDGVPRFGFQEYPLSFEVQLFEESNDIVFLYQSVDTEQGARGSSATIGIQHEVAGVSLQYSCNQPAVASAGGLHIMFPNDPGGLNAAQAGTPAAGPTLKAEAAALWQAWAAQDAAALRRLQLGGLTNEPGRVGSQERLDVTGDDQSELVWLTRGGRLPPRLTVLNATGVLFDDWLVGARVPASAPTLFMPADTLVDITGDGLADLVVYDFAGGGIWLFTWSGTGLEPHYVATGCQGKLRLSKDGSHGLAELVRDACQDRVGWELDALDLR